MQQLEMIEISEEQANGGFPVIREFAPVGWIQFPCARLLAAAEGEPPTILDIFDRETAIAEYRAGRLVIPDTVRFVAYA